MLVPQIRFTVRRLMVGIAITAFELGLSAFLYREARRLFPSDTAPWAETGVQLVFLNLLIGGPAWLLMRALQPEAAASGQEGPNRR